MKVKALTRSEQDYRRERKTDNHKFQRNYDPVLHPFERAREYTRALNATKLDKLFSAPFLAAMDGHADSVYCMGKNIKDLQSIVSGSGDGEVRVWKLNERKCIWSSIGHRGIVKGVCFLPQTGNFISAGIDKSVKIWDVNNQNQPINIFQANHALTGVDHHRQEELFATSGSTIDLWDVSRSKPIKSFDWGADTISTVKFNQTETNIVASCGTDRAIALYDIRTRTPLHKMFLTLKSNSLAWNPMEAMNFVVANEDHNCYEFDMRAMNSARKVFIDHVSSVMDVDYSPTGDKLVTGSYDRTVRVFDTNQMKSINVYHTKRMQRVFSVKFTMDNKYVVSGSEDTNLRLWKANASERLGVRDSREIKHKEYTAELKKKFAHFPEIKRIATHHLVPSAIKAATRTKSVVLEAHKIKEMNRANIKRRVRNPKLMPKQPKDSGKAYATKSLKEKIVLRTEE